MKEFSPTEAAYDPRARQKRGAADLAVDEAQSGMVRGGVGAKPFLTDEGHVILDCTFESIQRPRDLASLLDTRAGIVEHGLFLGIATDVLVGDDQGGVRHLCRRGGR